MSSSRPRDPFQPAPKRRHDINLPCQPLRRGAGRGRPRAMTTRASRVTEGRPDILYCHDEDFSRPVTERDGTLRARTLTRLIVCPVGVADLAGMEVSRAVALRGPGWAWLSYPLP